MKKLSILGAGSWGLTLAWLYADPSYSSYTRDVCLWDRKPEKIAELSENRQVTFPVPVELPEQLHLTDDLNDTVHEADIILLVVTSAGTRETARKLRETGCLRPDTVIVNCSKGIELPSLKRMSDVLKEELPDNPTAVMSGPTLAKEILAGLPTAASVACDDPEIAEYLQIYLTHDRLLRLYSNTDVVGVELGGSLKNIFAIASGFMRSKQLGDNAWASLVTRGLAEMTRFSVAMGAKPETLYGLSGLGDMLATCNSPLSRNYQVGLGLAEGKPLDQVLTELQVVAEGVKTTEAVHRIAANADIDMPVVDMVYRSLSEPFNEEMIIKSLMRRKLKSESPTGG